MALKLDTRQRAMLQEMGVHVWLPESASVSEVTQSPPTEALRPRTTEPVLLAPANPRTQPIQVASIQAEPAAGERPPLQELDWPELVQAATACQACGLCAGRKHATLKPQAIPGQADWLFVGDPPDADEDRLGQPFVEQAGALLDNMLKAAGVSRSGHGRQGAHLSNVVKCRPPPGRLPQAADLTKCAQYLQREVQLVQPKVIVAMGRFAVQLLLQEHPQEAAQPLDRLRGRVYQYRGVAVVVTYHPQVLLRASANKAKAWADLCLAMDVLVGRGASLQ